MTNIKDFFKAGATLTDIEEIVAELRLVNDSQHSSIRKLKSNDNKLLSYIKRLKDENSDMKDRLSTLEDRMFSLSIVANTSELSIERSVKDLSQPLSPDPLEIQNTKVDSKTPKKS